MTGGAPTALITGGNGNLGRLVAARLVARGQRVIRFDLAPIEHESDDELGPLIGGDIRDTALLHDLIDTYRPQTIYHLASLLSGSSEADPSAAWEINATASFHLLRLASEIGAERFFFPSTAATYGPVDENPMPAEFPQWPESFYGATKVAVERVGAYFKHTHGLDFRCLRFPLVVSPGAPPAAVSAFPSHAFRAAAAGEPFSFPVAASTGVSTIFLDDVIDSIVAVTSVDRALLTRNAYNLHAYHLTARMVADAVKRRFADFEFDFEPVDGVERLIKAWPDVSDDSDARRDWGWNPAYDFERTADKMFELVTS